MGYIASLIVAVLLFNVLFVIVSCIATRRYRKRRKEVEFCLWTAIANGRQEAYDQSQRIAKLEKAQSN